ncbi:hypothetical protein [Paracoccus yeei]|uniref:hypothetical protein n=1 Tax=Paracoccus yeei TaxID=147645 RepID=UPI001314B442|nr:hypothetical protein [Paracoccus yeei]MBY0137951.1 hypothetical protein [Paracoccus yeei]
MCDINFPTLRNVAFLASKVGSLALAQRGLVKDWAKAVGHAPCAALAKERITDDD